MLGASKGLSFSLEWGVPNILGGHNFLERKIGGNKILDDQNKKNVGSHR